MAAKKKTGARKGERPFLTKAKINRFLRAIGNGCTVKAACGIVGMSEETQRKTGVKSAQWLLERRHGMTQTVKQELSGPDGGPIKHDVTETKNAILAKLAKLAERHGAE